MKKALIILTALALVGGITTAIIFWSGTDMNDAIEQFEAGDYDDALTIIRKLFPHADYDAKERMYYYRIRSVNGLADELEKKYDDELLEAALEKKGTPDYEEAVFWLEKKLKIHPARKSSRIISGGNFYNSFVSRYRGSRYIEDLDFEELKRTAKTSPGQVITASVAYYLKYPGSSYTAHLVKFIFEALEKGAKIPGETKEGLQRLLVAYGRQYSTSPEMNRLYDIKGEGINIRSSPGINAGRVGSVSAGDMAIQLAKSMDTTQVGDHRDYWYHIATLEGKKGWIFGKFLTRLDMSRFKESSSEIPWGFEDTFGSWTDSNTPEKWNHIPGGHALAISFRKEVAVNMVQLKAGPEHTAGLYNRYPATRAFTIEAEGRHLQGTLTLFAYVTDRGTSFRIDLSGETVHVNGRSIPAHAGEWHIYRLESSDGKFATLYIDNEMVSGRIPAVKASPFTSRGIYCLVSSKGKTSQGELKKLRVR